MKKWKWTLVTQLCPTLCDPLDCSLPGSSVHEILQARVLEWVAISFSRESQTDWMVYKLNTVTFTIIVLGFLKFFFSSSFHSISPSWDSSAFFFFFNFNVDSGCILKTITVVYPNVTQCPYLWSRFNQANAVAWYFLGLRIIISFYFLIFFFSLMGRHLFSPAYFSCAVPPTSFRDSGFKTLSPL